MSELGEEARLRRWQRRTAALGRLFAVGSCSDGTFTHTIRCCPTEDAWHCTKCGKRVTGEQVEMAAYPERVRVPS